MKQFSKLIYLAILIVLGSCINNNEVRIFIENQSKISDSLVIRDLITEDPIVILPYTVSDTLIKINEPIVVSIASLSNSDNNLHLGILSPNSDKSLKIDSSGNLKSNYLADSLLQYLFISKCDKKSHK
ncbi:MAG TPA: hypothetical protein PLM01_07840 [Bacteroidales bacterium]|nr:hypothetical protein [Bacteroidales bacterium]HQJ82409.1 hypothetical protein [Bacteroidales bacterium]